MVSTESVFVVAIIDSDFDRDRCINQSNNRSRNSDKIGVPAVRGTCKTDGQKSVNVLNQWEIQPKVYGPECLEVIFGKW